MVEPTDASPVKPVEGDQMQRVLAFCDEYRQVVEAGMADFPDPADAFGNAMIAAATFARMLAGHLIALGAYADTPEQMRGFARMLETNFSTGVALGKLHAMKQIAILEGSVN